MDDPEHKLEGWGANVVAEYRYNEQSNEWRPWSEVEKLMQGSENERLEAFAIAKLVGRNAALKRVRPMSRREVWLAGQKDLIRVDDWYLPHFMDLEKDAIELTVRANGLMGFRNELFFGRDEMLYRASVKNRAGWQQSLSPTAKVWALFNPLMPEKIWLVDKGDGHTMGTCPIFNRAPAYDRHAIEVAMGDQAADLAAKVLPIRGRHMGEALERAGRMARNLRVMNEAKEAAARGPAPDGEGYDFEALSEDDGRAGAPRTPSEDANADSIAFLDQVNAV